MHCFKKTTAMILTLSFTLLLFFPNFVSANSSQGITSPNNDVSISKEKASLEGRELLSTSEKVRIPFTATTHLNDATKNADTKAVDEISGYVDFWVQTYSGRLVVPFFEIGLDEPDDAFLLGYDFEVYYSGNEFNGGDYWEDLSGPIPILRRTYEGQGLGNIYTQAGSFSATLTGTVATSEGPSMVVSPNRTVYFKFSI
ncbi:hypothetical protein ACFSVM_19455 [Paenibacillus shunpengii]|uniref:Uncharacterized protein n=1 Tax=Paenibacillus shunpengii TaxID=2054424 RepID=A0ABW5SSR6_9BACL